MPGMINRNWCGKIRSAGDEGDLVDAERPAKHGTGTFVEHRMSKIIPS
jgi:hypothetical protein